MTDRVDFVVRAATADDAEGICAVPMESPATLGPQAYDEEVIRDWSRPRSAERYVTYIQEGARFFVALPSSADRPVLGFSSYRRNDETHGVVVYVSGSAARRGVGTALLRAAEAAAMQNGATELTIAASLVAVEFWKVNGFVELSRGEYVLGTGRPMACVHMKKTL
jgi:putative acetyltransferase